MTQMTQMTMPARRIHGSPGAAMRRLLMNIGQGYPERVEDVLDPRITFEPEVSRCVRRLARSQAAVKEEADSRPPPSASAADRPRD